MVILDRRGDLMQATSGTVSADVFRDGTALPEIADG
jgi:hypothetical protein